MVNNIKRKLNTPVRASARLFELMEGRVLFSMVPAYSLIDNAFNRQGGSVSGVEISGSVDVPPPTAVVVNDLSSTTHASGSGIVSLVDAIAAANATANAVDITFDSTVFATHQTLTGFNGALEISNTAGAVSITAPAAGVTIQGNSQTFLTHQNAIFVIDSGVIASFANLEITDGLNSLGGGAIINNGSLTITGCTIADSSSGGLDSGSITDLGSGGGIQNLGSLTLINSTLSGNSVSNSVGEGQLLARGKGGALFNSGYASLLDDTITANTGDVGGGIFNSGTLTIGNTIVAGNTTLNTSSADTTRDVNGTITSAGYNLIGTNEGSKGFKGHDRVGTRKHLLNAKLGDLIDNGGPTRTILPLNASPAISHGLNALLPSGVTTDQRGLPRTSNGKMEIGAVELRRQSTGLVASLVSSTLLKSYVSSANISAVVKVKVTNYTSAALPSPYTVNLVEATSLADTQPVVISSVKKSSTIGKGKTVSLKLTINTKASALPLGNRILLLQTVDSNGNTITSETGLGFAVTQPVIM